MCEEYAELKTALRANSGEYWQTMTRVSTELNDRAKGYQKMSYYPEQVAALSRYTQKRCHHIGVRFYAGYCAGGGNEAEWQQHRDLAIALQLVMTSAYVLNEILDHKKGVWNERGGVERSLLEYVALQSRLEVLLQFWAGWAEVRDATLAKTADAVVRSVRGILHDMHDGFVAERQLVFPCKLVTNGSLEWEDSYRIRNECLNRVYDAAPLLGYALARSQYANEDVVSKVLGAYSSSFLSPRPNHGMDVLPLRFSHVMQVVNDATDFLPVFDPGVKTYQDRFADVRNKIVTYPVRELLDVPEMVAALSDPTLTDDPDWQNLMAGLVKERGLMKKAKAQCQASWRHHVEFWRQVLGRDDLLLLGTYHMLLDNKYFKSAE